MSTAIYTLPLHAALPICRAPCVHVPRGRQVMNQQRTSVPVIELTDVHVVHKLRTGGLLRPDTIRARSEEHTSELQSHGHLVCRPLFVKKYFPLLIQP